MVVNTKKMSTGKWYCYATIDGYDYSFKGNDKSYVQSKMINLLKSKGKENNAVWKEVVIHPKFIKKEKPQIGYAKSRIDNL